MRYQDIKWEDDDSEFENKGEKKAEEQSFEELLKQEAAKIDQRDELDIRVGRQVTGVISAISPHSDNVLIELDPQHSGVMDKNQIVNEAGEMQYRVGDSIKAYVVSNSGDEIHLSLRMSQTKMALDDLRTARQNQLPVRGKVVGENKGGFEVLVMGKKAFCPVSQIDSRFVANKLEFIGKELNFLIEKIEEGGRNIVVSRSKLLRREAEEKINELEAKQEQEIILDGTVGEVRDYGAFVELGGFDGFLHVSEMSYSRVNRASEFLQKGDKIRVKVLKIETTADGKKRISLSMKAIQDDPWAKIEEELERGKSYSGRVKRLETFGAFVEVLPGIEGLIHVSEMSWEKRINHPQEILKVGDTVNVRVLDIQTAQQKLSLSLKNVEEDPWFNIEERFPVQAKVNGTVQSLKGFGAFVQLVPGVVGLLPVEILKKAYGESYKKKASPPQELGVVVRELDPAGKKILLTLPDIKDDNEDIQAYHEYMQSQDKAQKKKEQATPVGSFGALLAKSLEKGKKT